MVDRNRPLAVIGLLFAVLAVSIAVAVLAAVSLGRDRAVLHDGNVPYAVAIATAALNAKGIANDERGYLTSGKPEYLSLLGQHLLNVRTALAAAASAAEQARQHDMVEEAHVRFERWVSALQGQLEAYQAGNREAATRAALGQGREHRRSYEASLVNAEAAGATAIELPSPALVSREWAAVLLLSILLAVAICAGLVIWLLRTPRDSSAVEEPAAALAPPIPLRSPR
jgi:CHASE3 domain sensor protein